MSEGSIFFPNGVNVEGTASCDITRFGASKTIFHVKDVHLVFSSKQSKSKSKSQSLISKLNSAPFLKSGLQYTCFHNVAFYRNNHS